MSSYKTVDCKFAATGTCKFGAECSFRHQGDAGYGSGGGRSSRSQSREPGPRTRAPSADPGSALVYGGPGRGTMDALRAQMAGLGVVPTQTLTTTSRGMQGMQSITFSVPVQGAPSSSAAPNRHPFAAYFVVDTSSSMSGGKIAQALSCVRDISTNLLKGFDYVALVGFNSTITTFRDLGLKGAGAGREVPGLAERMAACQAGGSTELWLAMSESIKNLQRVQTARPPIDLRHAQVHLVVLTDGCDNDKRQPASRNYEITRAFLRTAPIPNFHLDLVTIGTDVDLLRLQQLASDTPRKVSLIAGADGVAGIRAAFVEVQRKMEASIRQMELTFSIGVGVRMADGGAMPQGILTTLNALDRGRGPVQQLMGGGIEHRRGRSHSRSRGRGRD